MKTCPYCGFSNREGILFCEDCGESLVSIASFTMTRNLDSAPDAITGKNNWGTARFQRGTSIVIHVRDNPEPIVLEPAEETVIGRADEASGNKPALDLTPYGAQEKGVSRIHAALRRGEETLTLVDLGSINGTHLNGQRLIPNQPRVLRDGDEVRLGMMICHIYFK